MAGTTGVTMNTKEHYQKVVFRLEKDKDDDGYPPNDWETLWGVEVGPSLFRIDNIPFFVRGVSCGDLVSVNEVDGELRFDTVVERSGHSVLRVVIYDKSRVQDVREALHQMGVETEQ